MSVCCCFHKQIKTVCEICIPKRKFTPKIEYNVSDEQIVVNNEQEMVSGTNLPDPYNNHSLKNSSEPRPAGGLLSKLVNDEKQKSADQTGLRSGAGTSAAPAQQATLGGKIDSGLKTTRVVDLDTGSQVVPIKTAPGYIFEFKGKKSKVKN